MRVKLLAIAATAALATVLTPAAAQANHSWGGYHWARTANPFTIALGDNVNSTWDSYLGVASADWSKSTVLDTTVVAGSADLRTCEATAGRVQICNAAYGSTGWLGIASISVTGGTHITQGTVKLNDTYFAQAQSNTPAERALVTCQEVGHTFGLDHQDENFSNPDLGTCMDYTNDPSTNQHPNQHDYDQLVTSYSHLDDVLTAEETERLVEAVANPDPRYARLRTNGRYRALVFMGCWLGPAGTRRSVCEYATSTHCARSSPSAGSWSTRTAPRRSPRRCPRPTTRAPSPSRSQ